MKASSELHEFNSEIMGHTVEVSVVLPPNFEQISDSLPLLINLHGGGGDRSFLLRSMDIWESLWKEEELPPLVMISFSSGPGSWYRGNWEKFVVDELPNWAAKKFNTRTDREGSLLTGVSMGGYGSLKIGFKYPERFKAIAPMEPAIEPSIHREEGNKRNTWYRMEAMEEMAWGSPFDENAWLADNPATIVSKNADLIRNSGLDIYLEVGDKDYINLHDGAEYMHRILWDNDIRHEYHLVRWADHVGLSMENRTKEAHRFLAASLAGGLDEPTDLILNTEEKKYLDWVNGGMQRGEPDPSDGESLMHKDPKRAPTVHRGVWDPLKETAKDDPEMKRAYAKLPPTK